MGKKYNFDFDHGLVVTLAMFCHGGFGGNKLRSKRHGSLLASPSHASHHASNASNALRIAMFSWSGRSELQERFQERSFSGDFMTCHVCKIYEDMIAGKFMHMKG